MNMRKDLTTKDWPMPRQPLPGGGWGAVANYAISTPHGLVWNGSDAARSRRVVWGEGVPTLWCTFQNGPYKPLDTTGSPIHVEPVPGPGLEPQTQVGVVAALTNAYGLDTAAIKLVTRTHPGGVRSVRLTLPGAEWVMSGGEGPERIYHRGAQEVARSEDYHLDIDPSADPMDSVAVVWLHAVRESGGW